MTAKETLELVTITTDLGVALVATSERGVCAVLLGDDEASLRADLERRFPDARPAPGGARAAAAARQVAMLIEGGEADVVLDPRGTDFQRRVWDALRALAPGETLTYGSLAARLGAPSAVRAVAGACAANPLAVLVPCHRVLRGDGGLGGYRWGLPRKRALLARERALLAI